MRNYHIIKNGASSGPYTVEQLQYHGITPETQVWHEGLPEWVNAQSVAELNPLFVVPVVTYTPKVGKPGIDWKLVGGMAIVIVVLAFVGWWCTWENGEKNNDNNPIIATINPCKTNKAVIARKNWPALIIPQISRYKPGILGGISDVKIRVYNNMDFDVDQVVVRIDYILENKRHYKSEYVFVGNIPANGNSEEVEAPGSDRGMTFTTTISKIYCERICLQWPK